MIDVLLIRRLYDCVNTYTQSASFCLKLRIFCFLMTWHEHFFYVREFEIKLICKNPIKSFLFLLAFLNTRCTSRGTIVSIESVYRWWMKKYIFFPCYFKNTYIYMCIKFSIVTLKEIYSVVNEFPTIIPRAMLLTDCAFVFWNAIP